MAGKTVASAVSNFGASAKAKLSNVAISGAPEDQLRGPLEVLLHDLAEVGGLPAKALNLVGETTLAHLKTRPDYAVTVSNALVGFIEVKAPGKGADPRKFADPHDKDQWDKLKSLPNLLYTDGNAFSLWRDGELVGKIVRLEGDVETSGAKLAAPTTLAPTIEDFLRWKPIPPKTAKKLAEVCARLCRLLRDEVVEQMDTRQSGAYGACAGLAEASVPASGRRAICGWLRAGGDVWSPGRALARYFLVGWNRSRRPGTPKVQLADRDRAQVADRRRDKSGGAENVARHAHARARRGQLAHDQQG